MLTEELLKDAVRYGKAFTKLGRTAQYIPQLREVNKYYLGICAMDLEGNTYEAGDARVPFTIQSISKLVSLILAIRDCGADHLFHEKVGVEPTGDPFNSIVKLETKTRPFNPFINAGAIAVASCIKGADADEKFFASVGAGYRAPYLKRTAEALRKEDFAEWQKLPTEELRARLTALHGVGRKVADCVLLFGFNRFDVFPVDTWIRKVFAPYYGDMPAEKLSGTLVGKYGELSGFVQQWLFYYKREEKNSAKA